MQFEKKRQIIDLAHQSVSDPAKTERFIKELSAIYDKSQSPEALPGGQTREGEQVLDHVEAELHFEQAANAFARLWQQNDFRAASLRDEGDFVLLDRNGTIISVHADDEQNMPFVARQNVFSAPMDAEGEHLLKDGLKQIFGARPENVFCIVPFYRNDQRRTLWALSPATTSEDGTAARLSRIDFDWSQAAGEAITEAFGLSKSEQEILKTLVSGQSLTELATKRQRSVETVRTQAKSLLTKTGVSSQLDLVRLFAAITLVTPELSIPVHGKPDDGTPPGSLILTLPDNRQMQVEICGPPTGRPVVFLHNMFSGTIMPPVVLDSLHRHGIRLICPWRAGFAKSTAFPEKPASPERAFASDLAYLLDVLGIGKTVVVGHMSSAIYAATAAALLPDRFQHAVAISGFPPFLARRHIDHLPAWPRLFAYTARYFPKALSLLVRGTFGLLVENRIEVLFNNLFAGAAEDTALISDPVNRDLFLNDFRRAFEQGTAAYEIDAALAASDWSDWLKRLAPRRMSFIHGVHDPVTPLDLVIEIADLRPEIDLIPLEGTGQLALYQAPDRIIALLAGLGE
ncbi:alpha/beta fold hydrolase [Roseibium sp.]|uniref:alpha/beta fold hydrolase n=1 Tax=Roseibium sp. TaxID=1936156 RepID=UPI003A97F60A